MSENNQIVASEPVKTVKNDNNPGRPTIAEEQYQEWLKEIRPHLDLGCTLFRACVKAGLEDKYYSCIYEKYRLGDWFSKKVDGFREQVGDSINEAMVRLVYQILIKVKREELITHDEVEILKHMSEKHRTAQPFFVNRTEEAKAKDDDFGKVVERPVIQIIAPTDQIDDKEASQQVTPENNPPSDQTGSNPETVPSDQPTS